MSEHDFLIQVRRILLSAVCLLDKRIETLKNIPVENTDEQAREIIERIASKLQKEGSSER